MVPPGRAGRGPAVGGGPPWRSGGAACLAVILQREVGETLWFRLLPVAVFTALGQAGLALPCWPCLLHFGVYKKRRFLYTLK